MNEKKFKQIEQLLNDKKLLEANKELSSFQLTHLKNSDFLYLKAKHIFLSGNIYLAVDTLFISLQYGLKESTFSLLSDLYKILGNNELSKKLINKNYRNEVLSDIGQIMPGLKIKNHT